MGDGLDVNLGRTPRGFVGSKTDAHDDDDDDEDDDDNDTDNDDDDMYGSQSSARLESPLVKHPSRRSLEDRQARK